ncbi:MAG: helix-turn-helix domain-containing protein [Magnetococcales bacterium]|nr:helix-turn-helix domain-containing protein [Magnetococcales bacterium]
MAKSSSGKSSHRCPVKAKMRTVTCEKCELHGFLHILGGMVHGEESLLEKLLIRQQPVPKGETLFRERHPFYAIFAVKSGSFKSYTTDNQEERVLGFHLPGELLGLDAFLSPAYSSTVRALEESEVCTLAIRDLAISESDLTKVQTQVIRVLTHQINEERRQSLLAARRTAEERLAAFLLNISDRYQKRGLPGDIFRLTMLRPDIANFLGLAMETVSRILQRFREQELLSINGKQVQLLDIPCLQAIARTCPNPPGAPPSTS